MALKLRMEFPGAHYHVINRGNYRQDILAEDQTKAAFERCLFEACEKWRWQLAAFVLMRNHFHLAIGTPEGNLVRGMQWLEATFANRFNRFRSEKGHLFQGRYKALVIGGGGALGLVCDYIHLNPVRAGIVPLPELSHYRHSSYWYLTRVARRPCFLRVTAALTEAGGLPDDTDGWSAYEKHLRLEVAGGRKTSGKYENLSRGWAIGSDAFKAALIAQHAPVGSTRAWTLPGAQQMRESEWEKHLERALAVLGRTHTEAQAAPKSETWKLALATWMRDAVRARSNWLSQRLDLGVPAVVSRNLARYRCTQQSRDPTWQILRSKFSA